MKGGVGRKRKGEWGFDCAREFGCGDGGVDGGGWGWGVYPLRGNQRMGAIRH